MWRWILHLRYRIRKLEQDTLILRRETQAQAWVAGRAQREVGILRAEVRSVSGVVNTHEGTIERMTQDVERQKRRIRGWPGKIPRPWSGARQGLLGAPLPLRAPEPERSYGPYGVLEDEIPEGEMDWDLEEDAAGAMEDYGISPPRASRWVPRTPAEIAKPTSTWMPSAGTT